VREIHPDDGSESFSYHLLQFSAVTAGHIQLSRSRPYHKPVLSEAEGNDNPSVEQKSSSLVRAYLGREHLDTAAQTRLLNELYEKMGCYYNLLLPVMRMAEKVSITATDDRPGRIQVRYDRTRTPFDRLCETDAIGDQQRKQLMALCQIINPCRLRQEIYALCDELFSLPNAVAGVTENVHQSLHCPWGLDVPEQGSDQPGEPAQSLSSTYNAADLKTRQEESVVRPAPLASQLSARYVRNSNRPCVLSVYSIPSYLKAGDRPR
jgi:hypothetical protein